MTRDCVRELEPLQALLVVQNLSPPYTTPGSEFRPGQALARHFLKEARAFTIYLGARAQAYYRSPHISFPLFPFPPPTSGGVGDLSDLGTATAVALVAPVECESGANVGRRRNTDEGSYNRIELCFFVFFWSLYLWSHRLRDRGGLSCVNETCSQNICLLELTYNNIVS